MRVTTPTEARAIADLASEAIRALNHATLYADGCPGLEYPSDAYQLVGAMHQLATRLPQLFEQLSAYLQRELQHERIAIDCGPFAADPLGAIGTACAELEGDATTAARRLSSALDTAQQAIAFASYAPPDGAAGA
jgi:hypothetical protein